MDGEWNGFMWNGPGWNGEDVIDPASPSDPGTDASDDALSSGTAPISVDSPPAHAL